MTEAKNSKARELVYSVMQQPMSVNARHVLHQLLHVFRTSLDRPQTFLEKLFFRPLLHPVDPLTMWSQLNSVLGYITLLEEELADCNTIIKTYQHNRLAQDAMRQRYSALRRALREKQGDTIVPSGPPRDPEAGEGGSI